MSLPPFDRVVALHGATVYRVCRAVVGPELAEDAWSDTFLAALRAYPELPADTNFEAWLVTVAHRKALDQGRAARRRPVPLAEIADGAAVLGTPPPAPDALPGASADAVWAALRELPLKQRQTVAYHHLVGMPYAEIAALIGGTPEAARRAAADGIAALRRVTPAPTQLPHTSERSESA
jgi:RNA polymerase sigma factor (sigma-70 family)